MGVPPFTNGGVTGVAIADIGASKTVCMIARGRADGGLEILGMGRRASAGVVSGALAYAAPARSVLMHALREAEMSAGLRAHRMYVAAPGLKPRSHERVGRVTLRGKVRDRDMAAAVRAALNGLRTPKRPWLHGVVQNWRVDGGEGVGDPRGASGSVLDVSLLVVSGVGEARRMVSACVERSGLEIKAVVETGYAAALGVLSAEERYVGATVLDFGASGVRAAVFLDGVLAQVAAVPFGGLRATADLAHGLGVGLGQAEVIKLRHGAVDDQALDDPSVLPGGFQLTPSYQPARLNDVAMILRARVQESVELVHRQLRSCPRVADALRHVVVTGGGARMPGLKYVAAEVFDARVREGAPLGLSGSDVRYADPELATAFGLARYGLMKPEDALTSLADPSLAPQGEGGPLARAAQWVRGAF